MTDRNTSAGCKTTPLAQAAPAMADKPQSPAAPAQPGASAPAPDSSAPPPAAPNPEWAGALRQMYDAVLAEPLPDAIASLLAQLDTQCGKPPA